MNESVAKLFESFSNLNIKIITISKQINNAYTKKGVFLKRRKIKLLAKKRENEYT